MDKSLNTIETELKKLNIPDKNIEMIIRRITFLAIETENQTQEEAVIAARVQLETDKKARFDEVTELRKQKKKNV